MDMAITQGVHTREGEAAVAAGSSSVFFISSFSHSPLIILSNSLINDGSDLKYVLVFSSRLFL